MIKRLIQTMCLVTMVLSATTAISGSYSGYNNTQHPSIYFGGGEYRPFTQGFYEDMLSGNDAAYDNAYNNKYEWSPDKNSSSYYNPAGIPRVVWVSPSQY